MTLYNNMKRQGYTALLLAALACMGIHKAEAQTADFGIWTDLGVEKQIGKHWQLGAEGGIRTRDNSKTVDRWSLGANASYRANKYFKTTVGYDLLYDHRPYKETYHKKGSVNKITPAYWWPRHRFYLDLTGSYAVGPLKASLRERYQYTYRPKAKDKKYDTDTDEWEDVKSKTSHLLRSKFQLSYKIKKCPLTPFANIELFHGKGGLQKTRYTVGSSYDFNKHHDVKLYYRYQSVNDNDDDEPDTHVLGLGYTFSF